MTASPLQETATPPANPLAIELDSLFDMVLNGGPLMIPILLCSIIALSFIVERSLRLREGTLGSKRMGQRVVESLQSEGPEKALSLCEQTSLGRVLGAGIRRRGRPSAEIEKAVEDAGQREVSRLSANLKPLVVVGMIAPLLGLLGTVWGMIEAFTNIASKGGLGRPELLASGISQALITTAAGLTVAIPAQAAYYWFKGRIDRFVRRSEDCYLELETRLESFRYPQLESGVEA